MSTGLSHHFALPYGSLLCESTFFQHSIGPVILHVDICMQPPQLRMLKEKIDRAFQRLRCDSLIPVSGIETISDITHPTILYIKNLQYSYNLVLFNQLDSPVKTQIHFRVFGFPGRKEHQLWFPLRLTCLSPPEFINLRQPFCAKAISACE